jgi:hypothetical protein
MRLCNGMHSQTTVSEVLLKPPRPSGFASTETIRNYAETGLKPPRNQTETTNLPKTETAETSPYKDWFRFRMAEK